MLTAAELSIKKYAAKLCGSAPGVAAAVATPRRCDWVRCIPRDSCPGNFVALAASTATATASTAASSTRTYETYRRGKPRCNDSDFVPITRRRFRVPRDGLSTHPTGLISSILTPSVTGVDSTAIYNYILKKICK